MIASDRLTCLVPDNGTVQFECFLPGASALEWFSAITGALALLVAAIAAWVSVVIARKERSRADLSEKRSLRERLGNGVVDTFIEFEKTGLSGDLGLFGDIYSGVSPYDEMLDKDDPAQLQLSEGLTSAMKSAAQVQTYAVYMKIIQNQPIPLGKEIQLSGLMSRLSRVVREVVHGFAYSGNEERQRELIKKFVRQTRDIEQLIFEHTALGEEDR